MGFKYYRRPLTREEFNEKKKYYQKKADNIKAIDSWLIGKIDSIELKERIQEI